jgi:predicted GNAT family N-acyltransferase
LKLDFSSEELEREERDTHFAAFVEGELVGCLMMTPQNCSVVKMRQVAVEPRLQGQGIGAALVAASETWARESGYTQIELHARETAVPFYLRLGYKPVGSRFMEVKIPHQKMVRDLAADIQ